MVSRAQWALDVIEKEHQDCAFLLSELQQSMQAVSAVPLDLDYAYSNELFLHHTALPATLH